jgi:hypothetical protein
VEREQGSGWKKRRETGKERGKRRRGKKALDPPISKL